MLGRSGKESGIDEERQDTYEKAEKAMDSPGAVE